MSHDPYERAAAIRRGELDGELPSYDELTGWVQRIPLTWLPGLLARVVTVCVIRKVFTKGGLEATVSRAVEVGMNPTQSSLR